MGKISVCSYSEHFFNDKFKERIYFLSYIITSKVWNVQRETKTIEFVSARSREAMCSFNSATTIENFRLTYDILRFFKCVGDEQYQS